MVRESVPEASSIQFFFRRQQWHGAALLVLVPLAWAFAAKALNTGAWLGIPDTTWFWLALGVAIVHQVVVWVVWRSQLGWAIFSKLFGQYDLLAWGLLFMPLLLARPMLVVGLAIANRGSLDLPRPLAVGLGLALLIPAIYTLWSVARYFGIPRAIGGDHFRSHYRTMPLVRDGAFAWSSNAMYAFAFLGLWSIALLIGSQAALAMALFQHAYIWVHLYCTEAPDMDLLYGQP
jgi:hypothetical protein